MMKIEFDVRIRDEGDGHNVVSYVEFWRDGKLMFDVNIMRSIDLMKLYNEIKVKQ